MIKAYLLLLLIFLLGCNGKQKNADLEDRISKLEEENRELQNKLATNTSPPISNLPNYDNPSSPAGVYAFVLLTVKQEEYDASASETNYKQVVSYNYCSGIGEFSFVNNDLKYKLMDQTQLEYFKGDGKYKNGKVGSRECFVFSTYEEASKKREEYLTVQ
ncbi:hypothetical protein L0657_19860 [Dyadobacter sp. CY345]|uniref:hypothetical protein n=1 Tax=Dyadobacter sp. CY345 TaxID=2909335 RepID=UPI001F48436E|nr:hypothetical protein [Dyadobacter sp. CY345]MCF2446223.1 hypothetical protein [Dyadobacter sp. CY345]